MSTAENVKQQVLNYIRENIRDRFPEVTDRWCYLLYEW